MAIAKSKDKGKKAGGKPTKNTPKNLPVGRNTKRIAKKGNPTPKKPKKRAMPRFYDVKIRITADDYIRGQPYFQEKKLLPRFVFDAYIERVNRAESNNKTARFRALTGNIELLLPVLKEAAAQGRLDFFKEILKRPDVG